MRLLAGCRFACFQSCHAALSLPLVRCCCSVRLRAACFDCPVPCDLPRLLDCPFLIKAFQRMRCPAVLPVAVSWRLRPHHLAHPLGRRSLLRSSMPSNALPSHLMCHLGQFACLPLVVSPCVPSCVPSPVSLVRPVLIGMMSSPPCPIALPCRSACGYRLPRPACRLGWERDGTGRDGDGIAYLAIACPPCRRCLPWMASRLRVFLRCDLLCLLVCRHLCLYCDGEIVYMICPVAII